MTDPLKKLREDVEKELRRDASYLNGWDQAALKVIDAFCDEYEAVEVDECKPRRGEHWMRMPDAEFYGGKPKWGVITGERITILVPCKRKPEREPIIPDRIAHLEDEVHERCGDLGRRVCLLEYRTGAVIGGRPVSVPLREAAEDVVRYFKSYSGPIAPVTASLTALATALQEEER